MNAASHEIQWTPEKVGRLWDYYSSQPAYDSQYFGAQMGPGVARFVLRSLDLPPTARLLDLSCGRGDLIAAFLPLLKPGQSIAGTDPSLPSVETCRQRFATVQPAVQVEQTEGFSTPLPAEQFDLVMATEVIEHLVADEITAMLAEVMRLLRPGGSLLITTPLNENLDAAKVLCPDCGCVFHRWQHQRSWSTAQLQQRLEQAGFQTTIAMPVDWGRWQPVTGPLWEVWARRLFGRFRRLPPPNGLVYLGRK